jgi:hypothetical protein
MRTPSPRKNSVRSGVIWSVVVFTSIGLWVRPRARSSVAKRSKFSGAYQISLSSKCRLVVGRIMPLDFLADGGRGHEAAPPG